MTDLPLFLILANSTALREAVAQKAEGFTLRWSLDPQANEVAAVAAMLPALIVIELDRPAEWLHRVRADPATRRIPVIAIAVDEAAQARAQAAHVDAVFSPEEFVQALPDVLTKYARLYGKSDILRDQCEEEPPPLVLRGLHEFNAGEYFECHETLEEAWNEESGPVRELYRAILQVSIAYYHIQRGNFPGAQKMFLRMVQWFAPLPDRCQGIDVGKLRADVVAARAELDRLGPEHIVEFDRSLFRPVVYTQQGQ